MKQARLTNARLTLAAVCMLLVCSSALADPPPTPTLHAETRVVQIEIVVTDSHGKAVTGLSKEDFSVTDEGKPRLLDFFAVNSGEVDDRPGAIGGQQSQAAPTNVFSNLNPGPPTATVHSTAIVLDAIDGGFVNFQWARQGVIGVLQKVKPDERIALYVISYKQGLVLLQDYTTNHALLLKSMSKYIKRPVPPPPPRGNHPPNPEESDYIVRQAAEGTRLSLQGLADHLSLASGRKNVFLLSTGFPPRFMQAEDKFAWDKTITALNEANVAVNTVDPVGVGVNRAGTLVTEQQIADATGGRSYFGRNDVDELLAEGIETSRTTYTLGFYLPDNERDEKFHAVTVKLSRPGLQAFYRQGYYAGNTELPASAIEKTSRGDLSSALLNQVDSHEIGITASVDVAPGNPRGTLNVGMNLSSSTLSLKERGNESYGKVEETFVEVNESGNTLAKVSDVREFAVTSQTRAHYDSDGVKWPLSIPLIQGATKLVIAVRDTNSGRVGSLTIPLSGISPVNGRAGPKP